MSSKLQDLIRKYGTGSNSFLALYEGYKVFENDHGMIAFVDTPHAWVGATEPFCAPEKARQMLDDFRAAGQKTGKEVFMLPVSKHFADEAEKQGYSSLMIGSEPTFILKSFMPDFREFHSAKHLNHAGAKIMVKNLEELTTRQRAECDDIFKEWMGARWMAPLSFLNQVSPWEQGEHKKYFLLHHQGRCLGFLAAVPVWATQGWYLVDLMKRKDAPPGSTEMILLEAMRILKEQGAEWVSLGLSPLSGLEDIYWNTHPILYRLLNAVFYHGNTFYRFRPLFEFKKKLNPSNYPHRYLISSPKALRPRGILSLMRAFVPGGISRMAYSSLSMRIDLKKALQIIPPLIRPDVIPRALPPSLGKLAQRSRVSLLMALASMALMPWSSLKQNYSFTWEHLRDFPLLTLAASNFLHENPTHLLINLTCMVTGMLCLELLLGGRLTLWVYAMAAIFSNAITLGALRLVLGPQSWLELHDVGASLGIFGCFGGLCFLLKKRHWVATFLHLVIVTVSITEKNWMALNHLVAFWIGYLLIRIYFQGWNSMGWVTRKSFLATSTLLVSMLTLGSTSALAEGNEGYTFLPESRHQQYQPYAFFTDEQSSLLYRTAGRAWGEVGGAFALLETPWFKSWHSQPQLVFIASANAGYRINASSAGVFTDTIDARIGFNFEGEPVQGHRIFVGFLHMSGHISDDIQDKSLIGSNFGWEQIRIRYTYAGLTNFRFGGTLSPIYSADPSAKLFSADQFFEWFPNGLSTDRKKGSLYFSAGLEQYGADRIQLTSQAQLGYLFGNHDRPIHEASLRVAVGYYTGADPRLKYMGFFNATTQFGYAGVFIDM